jgi:hypothetical protein
MTMPNPATYVQPIHFEDFDGGQFERLVFAYHAHTEKGSSLEWYGQVGSDLGRDIWLIRGNGESVCIQCVNRGTLRFAKIRDDISKVTRADHGVPDRFRVVGRANVFAEMRDKIKALAQSAGINHCDIWSGQEFEEFLRNGAESLLKRFIHGEVFPDTEAELSTFAQADEPPDNNAILATMAKLFDRPAFYTPIQEESNLPDFKQAITDTIQALNTGIWKARDGHLVDRIASRHQLKDAALAEQIRAVEVSLAELRAKFDAFLRSGAIRHCGCQQPNCPTYSMPSEAAHVLGRLRSDALKQFRDAYPAFVVRSAW